MATQAQARLGGMRWSTRVELTCGCFQRFEQVGYSTPIPQPGDSRDCSTHGEQAIEKAWRHGR